VEQETKIAVTLVCSFVVGFNLCLPNETDWEFFGVHSSLSTLELLLVVKYTLSVNALMLVV